MCYLVTGINPNLNSAARQHQIFDTEELARADAERLVNAGHNEVAVWKQIATPSLEKKVVWEEKE